MGHRHGPPSPPTPSRLFRQHLLGGVQLGGGRGAGRLRRHGRGPVPEGDPRRRTAEPMELDVAADGSVFYISRSGKVNLIPAGGGATGHRHPAGVYTAARTAASGWRWTRTSPTNGWIYLNYSPASGGEVNRVSRFTFNGDPPRPDEREEDHRGPRVPAARRRARPHRRLPRVRAGRRPVHRRRRRHANLDSNWQVTPRSTSAPAGRCSTPRGPRPTPTTCAARSCASTPRPTAGTRSLGQPVRPGHRKTRPEIYAMGFRNPFRFTVDGDGLHLRCRLRSRRRRGQPQPRPRGLVEWNIIRKPGYYGWPYCVGNNIPYNDYDFATGRLRREVRLREARQRLARTTPA